MSCKGGTVRVRGEYKSRHEVRWFGAYNFFGPTVSCADIYALLPGGRCFRVERKSTWYIYNDTDTHEMHITCSVPREALIQPLGLTTTNEPHAGTESQPTVGAFVGRSATTRITPSPLHAGWLDYTVIVYPLCTQPFLLFIDTDVPNYSMSVDVRDLSVPFYTHLEAEASKRLSRDCGIIQRLQEVQNMQKRPTGGGAASAEEQVLYLCRKKGLSFVDPSFPPTAASLSGPGGRTFASASHPWMKPEDLVPHHLRQEVAVLRSRAHPSSIRQGSLGDCWLMSSLALIALQPDRLRRLLRHPVRNSKRRKERAVGGYRIFINRSGWWTNVLVDAYLPTKCGTPCFGQSAKGPFDMWVSLLEKAFAKSYGSYSAIEGGSPVAALTSLTGCPSINLSKRWEEAVRSGDAAVPAALFATLRRYLKKKYLVAVWTPGTDTQEQHAELLDSRNNRTGLRPGHAYSLMDIYQFPFGVQLLKLRNPWGSEGGWSGAWGRDWPGWAEHGLIRSICKPSKNDDGTFYMCWQDAVKYLDGAAVCFLKEKRREYRLPVEFRLTAPPVVLCISVQQKEKVLLMLNQRERLGHGGAVLPHEYMAMEVTRSRRSQQELEQAKQKKTRRFDATTLRMQEFWNSSSHDPEAPGGPGDAITYFSGNQVSMMLELDPKYSPYLVVPRLRGISGPLPVPTVLSVLTPAGGLFTSNSTVVEFLTLPVQHEVYANSSLFNASAASRVEVCFQDVVPGHPPIIRQGTSTVTNKQLREPYPFPY